MRRRLSSSLSGRQGKGVVRHDARRNHYYLAHMSFKKKKKREKSPTKAFQVTSSQIEVRTVNQSKTKRKAPTASCWRHLSSWPRSCDTSRMVLVTKHRWEMIMIGLGSYLSFDLKKEKKKQNLLCILRQVSFVHVIMNKKCHSKK